MPVRAGNGLSSWRVRIGWGLLSWAVLIVCVALPVWAVTSGDLNEAAGWANVLALPITGLGLVLVFADQRRAGAAPAGAAAAVPRQLPLDVDGFTGRDAELAALDAVAGTRARGRGAGVPLVVLCGTAGVGKSALAVHWAHRVADRFPDGHLFVNLRGFDPSGAALEPGEALRGFLDALAVPPERIPVGLDAQAALYRSLLADRRMLVLLDNARSVEQVRPLLPGTARCLVVVTSRSQMGGLAAAGAHPVTVDLLTEGDARRLLALRCGTGRAAAEPEALQALVDLCARLPLALAVVAARAATHPAFPLAELAAELSGLPHRLDAFSGGDPTTDLRALFDWSSRTLSPPAERLFRSLGLHPGPEISAAAAASLAAIPRREARSALAELTRAHLLVEHRPGRYGFHDLLRSYAAERARDVERAAVTRRMLDHYLHSAHAAARLLNPVRVPIALDPPCAGVAPESPEGHRRALEWFAAEHPVLLALVQQALAGGLDAYTWRLAWTMWTFLEWQGHWHDLAATQSAALRAADRLADPATQAWAHRLLGRAYTHLRRYDDAAGQLAQALAGYEAGRDTAGQAHTHVYLAQLAGQREDHDTAIVHASRALALFPEAEDDSGKADALNVLGTSHARLGQYDEALAACQRALTVFQRLDNRYGEAYTWEGLGYAHHRRGGHDEALSCYGHALRLFQELGDRHREAIVLARLGDTHHATGEHAAAGQAWEAAAALLRDIDPAEAARLRER
ncbi:ATP-binding protein [Phytohabitans houttuyneae]|uniref:Uncharacterized protein n=1 Tax=Phytohabitans houttuyneae TaxID=1076126 RepID=A0A6V8KJD0_9ACTN|nr:tetratricopeptide repeat protein [Phytohabitans houttuyneae]GFJ83974.1 hypothetical protein Phou_081540 [Phytohabitans houttuyneae]